MNVVNRGFEYVCAWMAGSISSYSLPTYVGWGGANGYNDAAVTLLPATAPSTTVGTGQWSDVAPYQEFSEARVNSSPGTVSGNTVAAGTVTVNYVATITATGAHTAVTNASTGQVAESFLVFNSTKATSYALNSSIAATNTTFTVASGTLVNGYYQVNNEVVHITAVSGNTIATTVVRAQNGSVAGTAATGDTITPGNVPGAGANNPSNQDLFAHAGFVGLSLNNGDSVQFTWQINVTS